MCGVACRVSGIVGTIHASWPGTRVIVMGILPRGTSYWDGGSASRTWPNVLTPAINALNNALQVQLNRSFHSLLLFVALSELEESPQ